MAQPFPHFPGPYAFPDGRTWTAEFESFDQRNDDAYYFVSVTQHDGAVVEFFVRADVMGGVPERDALYRRVAELAERGSNTPYQGSVMWQIRRAKAGKA